MSFDRLLYIDRLKMAGIEEPLARAHAEALRDALSEAVATKADLNDAVAALKVDLNDAVAALKADINDLRRYIDDDIRRLDRKIDQLENKIEIMSRDLVIKGAGGLVLVSSLMIGLKLIH